jgi:hypothetical protein
MFICVSSIVALMVTVLLVLFRAHFVLPLVLCCSVCALASSFARSTSDSYDNLMIPCASVVLHQCPALCCLCPNAPLTLLPALHLCIQSLNDSLLLFVAFVM